MAATAQRRFMMRRTVVICSGSNELSVQGERIRSTFTVNLFVVLSDRRREPFGETRRRFSPPVICTLFLSGAQLGGHVSSVRTSVGAFSNYLFPCFWLFCVLKLHETWFLRRAIVLFNPFTLLFFFILVFFFLLQSTPFPAFLIRFPPSIITTY